MRIILGVVAALSLVAGIVGAAFLNPAAAIAGFVQFVVAGSAAAVLERLEGIEKESKEQTKLLRVLVSAGGQK